MESEVPNQGTSLLLTRACWTALKVLKPQRLKPTVSRDALKEMRQTIRGWHVQLMCDKEIDDISHMFNSVVYGWHNYYSRFYESEMCAIWKHMNWHLMRWLMWKYKKLARHKRKARYVLGRLARANPNVFIHWKLGYLPSIG